MARRTLALLAFFTLGMAGCAAPAEPLDPALATVGTLVDAALEEIANLTVAPPARIDLRGCMAVAGILPAQRSLVEPFVPAGFAAQSFPGAFAGADDPATVAIQIAAASCGSGEANGTVVESPMFFIAGFQVVPPAEYAFPDHPFAMSHFVSLALVHTDPAYAELTTSMGVNAAAGSLRLTVTGAQGVANPGFAFDADASNIKGTLRVAAEPGALYAGTLTQVFYEVKDKQAVGAINMTLPPWGQQVGSADASFSSGAPLGQAAWAGVGVRAIGEPLLIGIERTVFRDGRTIG